MRKILASLLLALTTAAYSQVQTPEMNKILTSAAQALGSAQFDRNAPVSIHGRVSTLVWPEGGSGMLVIEETQGGGKYAFSTAKVAATAKQGFTRFAIRPGQEVLVVGVLATGNMKIGPGFTGARADLIQQLDGKQLFNRELLP